MDGFAGDLGDILEAAPAGIFVHREMIAKFNGKIEVPSAGCGRRPWPTRMPGLSGRIQASGRSIAAALLAYDPEMASFGWGRDFLGMAGPRSRLAARRSRQTPARWGDPICVGRSSAGYGHDIHRDEEEHRSRQSARELFCGCRRKKAAIIVANKMACMNRAVATKKKKCWGKSIVLF